MKKRSFVIILSTFLLISLVSEVCAQIGLDISDTDRTEFEKRRKTLMRQMDADVAILFGEYQRSDMQRFRQNNRFYYLTGVEVPFAVLVLEKKGRHVTLFLEPGRSGINALFDGTTLGPGNEAEEYFGIEKTKSLSELQTYLSSIIAGGDIVLINTRATEVIAGETSAAEGAESRKGSYGWSAAETRQENIARWLGSTFGDIQIEDVTPIVDEMRRVKSEAEIARMIEACRIAGEGHIAAMKATNPEVMEYSVEAAATGAFINRGAFYPGYSAIVGSGPNNNILHYSLSSRKMKSGELVLMDFGPDYRYCISDVTRTWPVDSSFSEKHKRAYADLLEVQKQLIESIEPGMLPGQLNVIAYNLLNKKGYGENIKHGVSHYIGMSVHDVGDYSKPLEPGVTLTVEPGVYFIDEGWGIRIEDTVLVTKKGSANLSCMIPKEINQIEAIRQGGQVEPMESSLTTDKWKYNFSTDLVTGKISYRRERKSSQ